MKLTFILFMTCLLSFGQSNSKDSIILEGLVDPEMPEYPGGMQACIKYIQDNVVRKAVITEEEKYNLKPAYAKFTIAENGKVINVRIAKSSNVASVDSLFKIALEKMPNWKPVLINGKAKSQDFNLPLILEIK